MNKEKHKEIIRKFLQKRYGLNIEAWVSINDHLHQEYTFGENMDVMKNLIIDLMSNDPIGFRDRMTREANWNLQYDLMEHEQSWRDLIFKELELKENEIENY